MIYDSQDEIDRLKEKLNSVIESVQDVIQEAQNTQVTSTIGMLRHSKDIVCHLTAPVHCCFSG